MLGRKVEDVVGAQLKAALVDMGQVSKTVGKVLQLFADAVAAELRAGDSDLTFIPERGVGG